jgi:hypothetical protein
MGELRKVKYVLTVTEPDSTADVLFRAESETPFGAMNEGQLLYVDSVAGFATTDVSGRIGRIEHAFYAADETTLVQQRWVYLISDHSRESGDTDALAPEAKITASESSTD